MTLLPLVIAIGGNALIRQGERGTVDEQVAHADSCMAHIAEFIEPGQPLIITHGNGPFVGNTLIQMECAKDTIPPMPLFIADADSEGGIGFILQQSLYNQLAKLGKRVNVVSVVTQVVVDKKDPAFIMPEKPVGPFFSMEEARFMSVARGWAMSEDAGRGWRRVVPSPRPIRIIEADTIRRTAQGGDIVIAAGGGGVPVVEDENGLLRGIDAVIDKDLASSLLARQVGAKKLMILTSVDCVYLDYGKPAQRRISRIGVSEAKEHLAQGQFPPGSMGPKVQAAIEFIEHGGGEVIITSPEMIKEAISSKAGTVIA